MNLIEDTLDKYTTDQLESILDQVEQMIVIPIINVYNLTQDSLKTIRTDITNELDKRRKLRVPMTQRTWEWYKKEIARLEKVDKEITDKVRATYKI